MSQTDTNFDTFSLRSEAHVKIVLGHTRQGLKCRICKMNVHLDCQDKASKCQAKARLLRRQKSTSEIETRVPETTVEEESKFPITNFQNFLHLYCVLLRIFIALEQERGRQQT